MRPMFIPALVLGLACLALALLLTLVFPIQRGRLRNQIWDLVTLALFVLAAWWLRPWDAVASLAAGLLAGLLAVLVRDFRLWLARFRGQVYRRTHRYYWYGRAGSWLGGRRRRSRY